MSWKIFENALVFQQNRFHKTSLMVHDNVITMTGDLPADAEHIDCSGKRLIPGFLDIHTHGAAGCDFTYAKPEEIHRALRWYASKGITSVVPTIMTETIPCMTTALENIYQAHKEQRNGAPGEARIIGARLEGPFLGKDKSGAHDPEKLLLPDAELLKQLFQISSGLLSIVDIDPTLPGALDVIWQLRRQFVFSLAHTTCDYALAKEAFFAGAVNITHLFNGMNSLHHREPGLIGALSDFAEYGELIGDGIHVHPSVLRMIFAACPDKLVTISDSMSATGLSDGKYKLGGRNVKVKDGRATLTDGTLAGSVMNLTDSVYNLIACGVSPLHAFASVTTNAAAAVRLSKFHGSFQQGRSADFLVTNLDYQIEEIWINGERAYPEN
ncbi:MAG: N-acetylglucosamine-6-phosphate deacetylase [Lachnospiraceae bacterium]|nr:N-acetylglucosamine-6-phosphate deacetylase [Lachnospiraceae bacterium]